MDWKEACDEAKECLGFGSGWLDSDDWDEVVSTAKHILSNYREEEYLEYCRDMKLYYSQYMNSERWQEKRKNILNRDKHICFDCKGVACMVHHLSYDHLGTSIEEDDCISLCSKCHTIRHSKEDIEKNSRYWFMKTIDGFHTVMYCPSCLCQKTWTTLKSKKNVFVCDHCKLKLIYDSKKDSFRMGGF